jgi:hypothetical protein
VPRAVLGLEVIETMRGIEKITYILIYFIIFTPHCVACMERRKITLKLKRRCHLRDLVVGGRMILK